jgi:uncharacterized delta-60 repeat protein
MALYPDGRIMITGGFTEYDGVSRRFIARLHTDGSLDTSFDPGAGVSGSILTIQLQTDNKILIGGALNYYNNVEIGNLIRINDDGSIDNGFITGSGPSSNVYSIFVLPDNKIIIAGSFFTYNNITANRIARLFNDGSLDMGFNVSSGPNSKIHFASADEDDRILISGSFSKYQGHDANRIARLNHDGSFDTSFIPGEGPNNSISVIELQPDNNLLIGGDFSAYNNTGRNRLARIYGGTITSINRHDESTHIGLFPNPASTHFTIDMGKVASQATIEIFDLTGRLIHSTNVNNAQLVHFDRWDYLSGMYFIMVQTEDSYKTFKVILN